MSKISERYVINEPVERDGCSLSRACIVRFFFTPKNSEGYRTGSTITGAQIVDHLESNIQIVWTGRIE